ncbi:MAG: bifunctional DNA-formamidopyrimidine glycosylase/DNA-(apurinic or apyrimidinic site) lyase [Gammaproteobacteria bacterium]
MPELPEVETIRRGIASFLIGRHIIAVTLREPRLRWPVPADLARLTRGGTITDVLRRGKYLLLALPPGWIIIHLGMSGSLRVLARDTAPARHDHLDLVLDNGLCLRLRDPRRFGAVLWVRGAPFEHPLLAELGPEPWDPAFNGDYLYAKSRGRRLAIKNFIMDAHVVAGLGNIYANEALHASGIHPARAAGRIALARYASLADQVRAVLSRAIDAGGTTLRDFVDSNGRPGYFAHDLQVYDRAGQRCPRCATRLRGRRIGQRSAFYCPRCQR